MRVSVKADWRRFALAALALAALGEAAADFKIAEVQPKFTEQSLTFAGNLDLGLSAKVEEALAKGIPLEVVIDIRLYHQRRYLGTRKSLPGRCAAVFNITRFRASTWSARVKARRKPGKACSPSRRR